MLEIDQDKRPTFLDLEKIVGEFQISVTNKSVNNSVIPPFAPFTQSVIPPVQKLKESVPIETFQPPKFTPVIIPKNFSDIPFYQPPKQDQEPFVP